MFPYFDDKQLRLECYDAVTVTYTQELTCSHADPNIICIPSKIVFNGAFD